MKYAHNFTPNQYGVGRYGTCTHFSTGIFPVTETIDRKNSEILYHGANSRHDVIVCFEDELVECLALLQYLKVFLQWMALYSLGQY